MLTFCLDSKYVFLVTGKLSKAEFFENPVWLGTHSQSTRESSEASFGLETTSLGGLERSDWWCVFACQQDTQKWDSWNTEQLPFFMDLSPKPSKGIKRLYLSAS